MQQLPLAELQKLAPEFGHSDAYFAEVVADPITESPTEVADEPLDEMVAPAATKAEIA